MSTDRNTVRAWMRRQLHEDNDVYEGDIYDPVRPLYLDHCGICNLTRLAEDAAHHAEHDEWLDDPDHWVWEEAVDIADALGVLG